MRPSTSPPNFIAIARSSLFLQSRPKFSKVDQSTVGHPLTPMPQTRPRSAYPLSRYGHTKLLTRPSPPRPPGALTLKNFFSWFCMRPSTSPPNFIAIARSSLFLLYDAPFTTYTHGVTHESRTESKIVLCPISLKPLTPYAFHLYPRIGLGGHDKKCVIHFAIPPADFAGKFNNLQKSLNINLK